MARQIIDGDLIVIDSNGNEINVLDSVGFPDSSGLDFNDFLTLISNQELVPGKYYLVKYDNWTEDQKTALQKEFLNNANIINSKILPNTSSSYVAPSSENVRYVSNPGALLITAKSTNDFFPEFRFFKKESNIYSPTNIIGKVKITTDSSTQVSAPYVYYMKDQFNNECSYDFYAVEYRVLTKDGEYALYTTSSGTLSYITRRPVDIPGKVRGFDFSSGAADRWLKTFNIYDFYTGVYLSIQDTNGFYRNNSIIDSYGCFFYITENPYQGYNFDFVNSIKGENIRLNSCISCLIYTQEIKNVSMEMCRNVSATCFWSSTPGPATSRTFSGKVLNVNVKQSEHIELAIMDIAPTNSYNMSYRLYSNSISYGTVYRIYNIQNIDVFDSKLLTLYEHILSITGNVKYPTTDDPEVTFKIPIYINSRTQLGGKNNSGISYNNWLSYGSLSSILTTRSAIAMPIGGLPLNTNTNPKVVCPTCLITWTLSGYPSITSSIIDTGNQSGSLSVFDTNSITNVSETFLREQD